MVYSKFGYFNRNNIIFLFVIVFLYLLVQLPFLDKIPNIMVDEPWYANVSHNFAIGKGIVNTNPGARGGDELVLYTFMLGVFFKIFGTTLFSARIFSVIGGILGVSGLICILFECKVSRKIIFLCCLLFIFSNVNYIIFRTVRPDSWVVVIAIWAFYFLLLAINNRKEFFIFLCGLLVSSTFICHPNGALYILIFGIIVCLHSAQNKNVNFLLKFVMGCLSILVSYLIFSLYSGQLELSTWLSRTSLESESTTNFLSSVFGNLILFTELYTLGIKRLFIFIFEIGILVLGLYYFKNKTLFASSFIGAGYFILAITFLMPFPTRTFGAVLIFSIIAYALILHQFEIKKKIFKVLYVLGILYLVNNFAGDFYIITKQYNHSSYDEVMKEIDEIVPNDTKVLTLLSFWFSLKTNENYNSYTRWSKKEYNNLEDLINSGDIEFVIISDYLTKGITPTSGRKTNATGDGRHNIFYQKAYDHVSRNGELVDNIDGLNYGNIEIWKTR